MIVKAVLSLGGHLTYDHRLFLNKPDIARTPDRVFIIFQSLPLESSKSHLRTHDANIMQYFENFGCPALFTLVTGLEHLLTIE